MDGDVHAEKAALARLKHDKHVSKPPSIHHKVNEDLRKCKNVQDKEVIFERLTNNCCVRNRIFDENLQVESLPLIENILLSDEDFENLKFI